MPYADPVARAAVRRSSDRKRYADPEIRQRKEDQRLCRLHGLTQEELDALRRRANGACELCGRDDCRLVIDHDHETKKVRGMVCYDCNRGLAFVDRPGWLFKARLYIEYGGRTTWVQ